MATPHSKFDSKVFLKPLSTREFAHQIAARSKSKIPKREVIRVLTGIETQISRVRAQIVRPRSRATIRRDDATLGSLPYYEGFKVVAVDPNTYAYHVTPKGMENLVVALEGEVTVKVPERLHHIVINALEGDSETDRKIRRILKDVIGDEPA